MLTDNYSGFPDFRAFSLQSEPFPSLSLPVSLAGELCQDAGLDHPCRHKR